MIDFTFYSECVGIYFFKAFWIGIYAVIFEFIDYYIHKCRKITVCVL